jgi:hypothetical protein
MNVDFLESFSSFNELTMHHHQKLYWVDRNDKPRLLRAGRFAYEPDEKKKDWDDVLSWCREAHKVERTICEELVGT